MSKIEPKIFDELKTVLSSFNGKYFIGEELNRSKLTDDLRNYDEELLTKLFEIDTINQHFIKEIAGQKIFQIDHLEESILYNDYWDNSYTKYENRVGLTSGGKFLEDNQDVVLDFPFKDGVLTASMTKEDNENGYDDAFLNEVIEKDEIDRLFDKKIFKNVKRYDENGGHNCTEFDKENDNLIIKGNNLVALHSLVDKYAGQVKLIYLDPPYNTGNEDRFTYNDNFKVSTWLTFMKNRLEIAKELLADDGLIFVQIDVSRANSKITGTTMQPYLHVLMDEIMGREKFVGMLHWKKKKQPSFLSKIATVMETILIYAKDERKVEKLSIETTSDETKRVDNASNPISEVKVKKGILYRGESSDTVILKGKYKNKSMTTEFLDDVIIKDFIVQNNFRVRCNFRTTQNEITRFCDEKLLFITANNSFRRFASEEEKGKPKAITDLLLDWGQNQDATEEINTLFGNKVFSTPKPEKLLHNIIKSCTSKNDLVVDFFMGSATTQAVAMKMNRRFIGIEQMDYINEVSVPRLQKVIEGEQGGISKDVNWQGGGSFIYAELFQKNMGYLQDIIHSKTIEELKSVFERMIEGTDTEEAADILFRADLSKIDWMEGFDANKRLLVKILDKNGLYYNYSEIDDQAVREFLSDEDFTFNKAFYESED